MLDRLVGRAVLAISHGIVREDENGRQLHQGRESDGWSRIIAEDEEGRAKGPDLRQRKTVDDCRHGMLADAEMQIFATGAVRLKISGAFIGQKGLGGGPKSAEPPRNQGMF